MIQVIQEDIPYLLLHTKSFKLNPKISNKVIILRNKVTLMRFKINTCEVFFKTI